MPRYVALVLVALLALAAPTTTWAQITIAQAPEPDTAAYTAGVKTYTSLTSVSTGQTVICGVENQLGRTFSSVTMGGQSATLATDSYLAGSGARIAQYHRYFDGTESGQDVVVTLSGSDGNNGGMYCVVVSGLSSTPAPAGHTVAGTGASSTVSAVTPAQANNVVIGYSWRGNRTWTNDAGWTEVGTPAAKWSMVYRIQTSATAQDWVLTPDTDGYADMTLVAYSASAGSATCHGLTLLGVSTCGAS